MLRENMPVFHSFSTGFPQGHNAIRILYRSPLLISPQILTLRNVKVYQRLQRDSGRSVADRDWGIPSQVAHYFHAVFIFPPHNQCELLVLSTMHGQCLA
jgi:hypothetical protein